MQTNPVLLKIMFPWIIGAVAVFRLLYLVWLAVGEETVTLLIVLSVGVLVILALLVGFSILKKKTLKKMVSFKKLICLSFR